MKKIMILGASVLQLPAILKAKEMGLHVIAVDIDKNAVGFKFADICLEISTIDITKIIEAAKAHKIDGIMTLASDMPMKAVAAVCEEMKLNGISIITAEYATNKAKMREILMKNNVPIPFFQVVTTFEEFVSYAKFFDGEFIIKPADNSGSRGVKLVSTSDDYETAFNYSKSFSRNGQIVVEEYMRGKEVSVETLTVEGTTHIIAITDKITTGPPYFVEMGHSQPTQLNKKNIVEISNVAIAAVEAIGITNGPSHTELMVTDSGVKVVELGARLGGDNITTHLVPLSTGIDIVKCCIQIALGNPPNFQALHTKGAAIRYFDLPLNGRIADIKGIESLRSFSDVKQITLTKSIGDEVTDIKNSNDRIGFVITQSENVYDAIKNCEKYVEMITINVF